MSKFGMLWIEGEKTSRQQILLFWWLLCYWEWQIFFEFNDIIVGHAIYPRKVKLGKWCTKRETFIKHRYINSHEGKVYSRNFDETCFDETCHRVNSNSRQRRRNRQSKPLDHRDTMATSQMAYINFSKMAYMPDF